MSDDLSRFYDFSGKAVLYIGAGGRQLIDVTRPKKLIAVDKDSVALRELKANLATQGLQDAVEVICASFDEVTNSADVVYFEFCLHEMDDASKALWHAKSLASDVVVYDHSAGSEWSYHAEEEDKVRRSSEAMLLYGIRRREPFHAVQRFACHAELLAKIAPQGAVAIQRAQRFIGMTDITIPMSYELNLL